MEIKVECNDIEKALKILKYKIQRDGLIGELKKRQYYEKPSVKLKNKQNKAKKRKVANSKRWFRDY